MQTKVPLRPLSFIADVPLNLEQVPLLPHVIGVGLPSEQTTPDGSAS